MANYYELTSRQRTRMQTHLATQSAYAGYTEEYAKHSFIAWLRDVALGWLAEQLIGLAWQGIKGYLRSLGFFWI